MWDDGLEAALGTIWETLSAEKNAVSADELRKKTGLGLSKIYASLKKMAEVDLLEVADANGNLWKSYGKLDALGYARAVEIGIPLLILEKTVGLSVNEHRQMEKIMSSGQVDDERDQRHAHKESKRKSILRGRAASRAATTDLAKIVQDAKDAYSVDDHGNKISQEIKAEAMKALEALITALEKR